MAEKQRVEYIDLIKGIAIILVVAGHCSLPLPEHMRNMLQHARMPLFVFLSGLFFSTCGGLAGGNHLGFHYVKALAEMLGIPTCVPYIIEGMDIDPNQRENLLAEAIQRL